MVSLAMNTRKLQCLGQLSPMFCLFGTERTPISGITEEELQDPDERQSLWNLHDRIVEQSQQKYQKYYKKARNARGGKDFQIQVGDYCYIKDRRQHEKPKIKPAYLSAPYYVAKNYGQTCLLKNYRGQTFMRHHNDLKRCAPRYKHLYENLPLSAKFKLGDTFDFESLKTYTDVQELPEMFEERDTGPKPKSRPQTRSNTNAQDPNFDLIESAQNDDDEIINAQSDSDPEESQSQDNDVNMLNNPTVTFADNT